MRMLGVGVEADEEEGFCFVVDSEDAWRVERRETAPEGGGGVPVLSAAEEVGVGVA